MPDQNFTGPVNLVAFGMPDGADLGEATRQLRKLALGHSAEILDVDLIVRSSDGQVSRGTLPPELGALETDLLDDDDLALIGAELSSGESALAVIYEDRTLASLAAALSDAGGRELMAGGIDVSALEQEEE